MPIYEITTDGEDKKRLVKATSSSAAIAHCAKAKFAARLITKVSDAADLMAEGVTVEKAGEVPVEPEAEKEAPPKDEVAPEDKGTIRDPNRKQPAGGQEPAGD